jgi:hypothetical protein
MAARLPQYCGRIDSSCRAWAIAVGLAHVYHDWQGFDALTVMDADGGDRPEDLVALLERFQAEGGGKVVFAARSNRLESRAFRFFYHSDRILHKALTGVAVRVSFPFRGSWTRCSGAARANPLGILAGAHVI